MKRPSHASAESVVMSRITEILISKNKSQRELVEYLGLTSAVYSCWKKGRSSSYLQHIDEISEFLDVSPTYLLYGDRDNLRDYEKEMLSIMRRIDVDQRNKLLLFARSMVGNPIE